MEKIGRMIITACSSSLFCLVLKQPSDNGLKLVSVLVFCDFGVILAHRKLCKNMKQSWNEFHFYPKLGIIHIWHQKAKKKRQKKFECILVSEIQNIIEWALMIFTKS